MESKCRYRIQFFHRSCIESKSRVRINCVVLQSNTASPSQPVTPAKIQSGQHKPEQKAIQKRISDSEKQQLVGTAVELVNRGDMEKAIGILDTVISGGSSVENVGPLITRGTARAMKRDLEGRALNNSISLSYRMLFCMQSKKQSLLSSLSLYRWLQHANKQ